MSQIQWTEATWNPVTGCSRVSPGCENCYAERMAWRLMHMPATAETYGGTVRKTKGGKIQWTGKVNAAPKALDKPLRTKRPTMFFVNSMAVPVMRWIGQRIEMVDKLSQDESK